MIHKYNKIANKMQGLSVDHSPLASYGEWTFKCDECF